MEDNNLKTSDYWYALPEELIAQTPLRQRDSSRLLVLDKVTGEVSHRHFYDILEYLQPGALHFLYRKLFPPTLHTAAASSS